MKKYILTCGAISWQENKVYNICSFFTDTKEEAQKLKEELFHKNKDNLYFFCNIQTIENTGGKS